MPNFFEEALTDPIILTVTSLQLAWGIYACYQLNKLKNHDSRQKINYYSFESIPSTFVTIGLFGTCLGIAIGLYHFDVNPTNIKSSVQLLLRGLKSAFFTTILGLLFSLIFKQIINHFLNKFADIQPPDSPELQQLREMNTNLRLLGENISESFRRKFDVFIDDMRETNEKLIHNLSTFTANLAEQNQEAQEICQKLNFYNPQHSWILESWLSQQASSWMVKRYSPNADQILYQVSFGFPDQTFLEAEGPSREGSIVAVAEDLLS